MRVKRSHQVDERTWVYQTDCLYTADGQVVGVRVLENPQRAVFFDVSRQIPGVIDNFPGGGDCETVEQAYLHGIYRMSEADDERTAMRELEQVVRNNKHHVPCRR